MTSSATNIQKRMYFFSVLLCCFAVLFVTFYYFSDSRELSPLRQATQKQATDTLVFMDKKFHRVVEEFREVALLTNSSIRSSSSLLPSNATRTPSGTKPLKSSFRSGGPIPRVFLYTTSHGSYWQVQMKHLQQCPRPCEVTHSKEDLKSSDAIMIYMRHVRSAQSLQEDLSPRDPTQPWVIQSFETYMRATNVYHVKYPTLNGIFNRTLYYRMDSDALFQHGFVVSRQDAYLLPESWRVDPLLDPGLNISNTKPPSGPPTALPYSLPHDQRRLAAAFISNCGDNSGRLTYVRALQRYITVDVYGACGNLKCGGRHYVQHNYKPQTDPCLRLAGTNYLFFLAFENSICKDYATEKVYNVMYYPIVPVVLGGANYSTLLPPGSYINAMHYSPPQLAQYLLQLASNKEDYDRFLAWRKDYLVSTIGGVCVMCDFCSRLYDPEFYRPNTITNFDDWFVDQSFCHDPSHK
ncbi:alpha-(1,3)-fucosyltransferase C-like [Oratosquilla oratoria]|uniref:alpha-(1,3)-fucosyltransferase C-like n=1 Tax=Oratosquilla oratoria TaxID=337810 RepID=UPI003F76040A